MKETFKKLLVMTREPQRKVLADAMQEFGLLHIEQHFLQLPEESEALIHELNQVKRLLNLLDTEATQTIQQDNEESKHQNPSQALDEIKQIESNLEDLYRRIEKREKEIARLTPWGEYNFEKFQTLIANGVKVYLGQIDRKNFPSIQAEEGVVEAVNESGSTVYFVWIGMDAPQNKQYDCFPLPEHSASSLTKQLESLYKGVEKCRDSLGIYLAAIPTLKAFQVNLRNAIKLAEVQEHFQEHFEGKFISITAWLPADKEREVRKFVEEQQVAWKISDPTPSDDVPVLLKNKKYPKLFEPITRVFELPNYYEADLTPFLAVFYPILFAYCLGDAGYGFVLATVMGVGYFSFFRENRNAAILGFILGLVTTFMGFIKSGSLFGIMLLPNHPVAWIRQLSNWVIIPDDSSVVFNAFNVALMIGVIQIITGILISIYNSIYYQGWLRAIMPFGKLLIVVSLIWIFLADMQEVGALQLGATIRKYLLIVGVMLVAFFHQLDVSIPKRLGGAFMPLFFIFTGILGDVLSYVRLFALGLASSVLGLVVNQIGMQIMEGGIISVVIGIVFLLFGHTLNFGIAALGSFVHPLRLTFVEFYGNVGFQGKGVPYQPFTKTKHEMD